MSEVVLVAPTAFKGTLTALEAARAMVAAVRDVFPDAVIISCPVSDGGDGFCEVLVEHLEGEYAAAVVTSASGEPIEVTYGWLPTDIAVIEMAKVSGLAMLGEGEPDPWHYTSRGVGELISTVLDRDPRRILIGAGGTATIDAGIGMMQALGVGFFDESGAGVPPGAEGVGYVSRVDRTFRDRRLGLVELIVACDVQNPLIGPEGAVRVFGPQKGVTPEQCEVIAPGFDNFAEVLMRDTGRWIGETPMAGAAGGNSGALLALTGAELVGGLDLVAEQIDLWGLISQATLVLVAEGSLDEQSLSGKAPVGLARIAAAQGVPVAAIAGRITLSAEQLTSAGIQAAVPLGHVGSANVALTMATKTLLKTLA